MDKAADVRRRRWLEAEKIRMRETITTSEDRAPQPPKKIVKTELSKNHLSPKQSAQQLEAL
jgi:hypothetical protein